MIEPFIKIGIVGVAGHALERHCERIGRPGLVGVVKIATYVVCGVIACVEWYHFFQVAATLFNVPMPW
jgi:hypothetical protein